MHPRTIATLAELENACWFSNVGIKDTSAAIVLSSWGEAIAHCVSNHWQDLIFEAANQYCERLAERSKDRFNNWNKIVGEVKNVTVSFVRRKIETLVQLQNLPPEFERTLQWDILHLCMEAEYSEVYPPGFFASHAYWYVKGHFPCGWQGGRFPNGTLIVY